MTRPVGIVVGVVVVLVVAALAYLGSTKLTGDRVPLGVTISDSVAVTASVDSIPITQCQAVPTTQRCLLVAEVDRLRGDHHFGSLWWSSLYHFCLFVGIICSGLAAYLAKLDVKPEQITLKTGETATVAEEKAKKGTDRHRSQAAVLAFVATVLASITAAGGFSGKWKANRDARARLDTVRIDLQDPSVTLAQVRDSLRVIIRDENGAINAAGPK